MGGKGNPPRDRRGKDPESKPKEKSSGGSDRKKLSRRNNEVTEVSRCFYKTRHAIPPIPV